MSHSLIYSTSFPMLGGVGHQVSTTFGHYHRDPFVQAWPPLAAGVSPTHLLSVAAAAFGQALHGLIAPLLNATRFQASPWMPEIVQFAAPPGLPGMPRTYVPYPPYPPREFFAPHPACRPYPSAGSLPPRTPSFAPARWEAPAAFTPTKLDPQAFFASAAAILEGDVSDMVLAHPAPGEPEPAFFAKLKHAGQSVIGELPMDDGRAARAEAIRLDGEAADGSWLLALNIDIPGKPPEHRLIRMHDVKTRPEDGERFLADLKRIDASLAKHRCGEEGRTLGVICHDGASESGAVIAGLNALGEADDLQRESRVSGAPMPSAAQFARSQREFLHDARDIRGPAYARGQDRELEALARGIYESAELPGGPAVQDETAIVEEPAIREEPANRGQPLPDDARIQPVLTGQRVAAPASSLRAICGDITRLNVDAIVNAAKPSLLGGSGVDGAIHRAAGPDLLKACQQLNGCEIGQAKVTSGFRLPARVVVHTVGPDLRDPEQRADAPQLLADAYRNSLQAAVAAGARTVAFPCISTGVYHFPKPEAARIAVRTVQAFVAQHPDVKVTFCCGSQTDLDLYTQELRKVRAARSEHEHDD